MWSDKHTRCFVYFWAFVSLSLLATALIGNAYAAQPIPPNAIKHRADLTRAAHAVWGLNAPVPVFAAQVHQESAWQPQALSKVGAQGMAQFMPATAVWWCSVNNLTLQNCQPTNPQWALRALVGYDKWLYDRAYVKGSGASEYDRMHAALRSYNGGLGHWQAEAKLAKGRDRAAIDGACGKAKRHRFHCTENLNYPKRILNVYQPRYFGWGRGIMMTGGAA